MLFPKLWTSVGLDRIHPETIPLSETDTSERTRGISKGAFQPDRACVSSLKSFLELFFMAFSSLLILVSTGLISDWG